MKIINTGDAKKNLYPSRPPFMPWIFYTCAESFGNANTKTQTATVLLLVLKVWMILCLWKT